MKISQTKLIETTREEAWQMCALLYSSFWGTLLEEAENSILPSTAMWEATTTLIVLKGTLRAQAVQWCTRSQTHYQLYSPCVEAVSIFTAKEDTLSSWAARLCFYRGKTKSETAAISVDSSSVFRRITQLLCWQTLSSRGKEIQSNH